MPQNHRNDSIRNVSDTFGNRFGSFLEHFWDHFWYLSQIRLRTQSASGPWREPHFEPVWRSYLGRFGNLFTTFLEYIGNVVKSQKPVYVTFRTLLGNLFWTFLRPFLDNVVYVSQIRLRTQSASGPWREPHFAPFWVPCFGRFGYPSVIVFGTH